MARRATSGRIIVTNVVRVRLTRWPSAIQRGLCRQSRHATQHEHSHLQQDHVMPAQLPEVVVFDTEFTAWRGSMARGWSGPGEHREIVQIGAVALAPRDLTEVRAFEVLIRPARNPTLSDYLVGLTRITNERLSREGVDFATGVGRFLEFAAGCPLHAFGRDDKVIAANAALLGQPELWPGTPAFDLRDWLLTIGVPLTGIHSGALAAHVGSTSQGIAHDALVDARSLAEAVRYLVAKGAPNPFLL